MKSIHFTPSALVFTLWLCLVVSSSVLTPKTRSQTTVQSDSPAEFTESATSAELAEFKPDQSTLPAVAPDNAVILLSDTVNQFLGRDGKEMNWPIESGVITSTSENGNINHIVSKIHFCDADIHVEFMLPPDGVGNSGVYIHGNYEMQIIDSHKKKKISKDDMGALYGFQKPLVNAALPPGQWQVYDIRYRAPRRNEAGEIIKPGSVTAFLNGKKVQDETKFAEPRSVYHPYRHGVTNYLTTVGKLQKKTMTGPVFLQDHNHRVKFRNVWIVTLDDKSFEYSPAEVK